MNVDVELMFECLVYLNVFHYAMFATCETIMTAAKYRSIIDTPYIGRDAAVVFTKLTAEFLKMLIFKKFKDRRRKTATAIVVLLTLVTISTVGYFFFVQNPILKLETILNSLTVLLASTEVVFGLLNFLPCCSNVHEY